jgi:hypothetical protein
MNTITTIDGYTLEVVKVYSKEEKFYGKVLIRHQGVKTTNRFDLKYFNSIVQDKDKINY